MKKNYILPALLFILISIIFVMFRIKPILFQTVSYTYDQGRDFLRASEIILNKDIPFIGPTTGITGLYHGAWWYYVLAIPFLLFRGNVIGFYVFNFFIHFVIFGLVSIASFLTLGILPGILAAILIATSPYFTSVSLFVGNNTQVPLFLVGFLMCQYVLIEQKDIKKISPFLFVINGLLLGMVGEFELSFGLMLIPLYISGTVLFSFLRRYAKNMKNVLSLVGGLIFAFSPRILFELKNGFSQTKTLLNFFFKPNLHNPKNFIDILKDRVELFYSYYDFMFMQKWILITVSIAIIMILLIALKKKKLIYGKTILFLSYLIIGLFVLSTLYKDSFWGNYYEGIQYIFLGIILLIIASLNKLKIPFFSIGIWAVAGIIILVSGISTITSIGSKPKKDGLIVEKEAINYILANQKDTKNYCVRIYTPPIFSYTYDYLFLDAKLAKRIVNLPSREWVQDKCWFIVENDQYKFRKNKWTKENYPQSIKKHAVKKFKDIDVEYYQTK